MNEYTTTLYDHLKNTHNMGYAEARGILHIVPPGKPKVASTLLRDKLARLRGWARQSATYWLRLDAIASRAPRLKATPRGYEPISEAEARWGRSLRDFAKKLMESPGKGAYVACVGGHWTVLISQDALHAAYGPPEWISTPMVARQLNLPYLVVYNRLRSEALPCKLFIAWRGGKVRVYENEEVQSRIRFWKLYKHLSTAALSGRALTESPH